MRQAGHMRRCLTTTMSLSWCHDRTVAEHGTTTTTLRIHCTFFLMVPHEYATTITAAPAPAGSAPHNQKTYGRPPFEGVPCRTIVRTISQTAKKTPPPPIPPCSDTRVLLYCHDVYAWHVSQPFYGRLLKGKTVSLQF